MKDFGAEGCGAAREAPDLAEIVFRSGSVVADEANEDRRHGEDLADLVFGNDAEHAVEGEEG